MMTTATTSTTHGSSFFALTMCLGLFGLLLCDINSREIDYCCKIAGIELQPREFLLLEYLLRHNGQVVTRTMLLEKVWDYNFDPQTNVIDVHISRLRRKIDCGFEVALLHTVRGAGYSLHVPR